MTSVRHATISAFEAVGDAVSFTHLAGDRPCRRQPVRAFLRRPRYQDDPPDFHQEAGKFKLLRRHLGDELADKTFLEWLRSKHNGTADPNVEVLTKAIAPISKMLRIPRGTAYAVYRKGPKGLVIEPVELSK